MKRLLRLTSFVIGMAVAHHSTAQVSDFNITTFLIKDTTELSPEGFYVLLATGEKKPGQKMSLKTGALVKDHITLDGTRYNLDQVKGYNSGIAYYAMYGSSFIRRFVHGKINLYYVPDRTYNLPYIFSQIGDDGPIKPLNTTKQVRALLADCPSLEAQVPHGSGEVRKAGRAHYGFMTKLFEDYNKGCTP
ncbi:MAG: hypothetical protein EOO16_19465 [Chitinophagaceae bacterium]|nr:MAG: hypothetical protein EOO16_19465 [Chitinophagaceae bacterium]